MRRVLDGVSRRYGWRRFRLPVTSEIGWRLERYRESTPPNPWHGPCGCLSPASCEHAQWRMG